MTWIFLLLVLAVIATIGRYKTTGEKYSAGRGMFRESGYDMPEDRNDDFNDYEPWNHDDMRE